MTILYIAWQDPSTRRWLPVGCLTRNGSRFRFGYTRGGETALETGRFQPFGSMTDLNSAYESDELFPLFANRILARTRPEFGDLLRWLDVEDEDPFVMLGRTGGIRETDSLVVFPKPEPNQRGQYEVHFFSHGVRHLPREARARIASLGAHERLLVMEDVQNEADREALALRTQDPAMMVGYVPRFLVDDVARLMNDSGAVEVRVQRANPEAPMQLQLLCRGVAEWPEGFDACAGSEFEPMDGLGLSEVA